MRSPDEYAKMAEHALRNADEISNAASITTDSRDRLVDYYHGRALVLAELANASALAELVAGPIHAPEKVEVERELADDLDRERYGRKS